MFSFFTHIEAILLVIALSTDAFVASFAYGSNKIKIPFQSIIIISSICSIILAISLFAGSILSPYINPNTAKAICFTIFFISGIIKLFDSSIKALIRKHKDFNKEFKFSIYNLKFILNVFADPEKADIDLSKVLSPLEAISLAVALSIDGAVAGFGAGLANNYWIITAIYSFIFGVLFLKVGYYLGNQITKKISFDLSWLNGLILIILAFMKLL